MIRACSPGGMTARALWLLTLLCLTACEDGRTATDAGTDGGDGDGDGDADGSGGQRPRSDIDTLGDPVVTCDRFDRFSCGAGQKCALLIRRAPGDSDYLLQTGCVDVDKERPLGAICTTWADEYVYEGLGEEVYLDPCAQGLVCSPAADVDGLDRCQPACQSGRYQGFAQTLCDDAGDYCSSVGPIPRAGARANPLLEWCITPASCDLGQPDSCGEGRACFGRLSDNGKAMLTECYRARDETVADFAPCEYIDDCARGSQCWGPVRVPPAEWTPADSLCRPLCTPGSGGGDADAGLDDADAGVGDDGCPAGTTCRAFTEGELSLGPLVTALGQCE